MIACLDCERVWFVDEVPEEWFDEDGDAWCPCGSVLLAPLDLDPATEE